MRFQLEGKLHKILELKKVGADGKFEIQPALFRLRGESSEYDEMFYIEGAGMYSNILRDAIEGKDYILSVEISSRESKKDPGKFFNNVNLIKLDEIEGDLPF